MTPIATLLLALCQVTISFGPPCQGFQTAKKRTYGFHPTQLTKAEREEKSKEMDEFWNYTRQLGPSGINCLTNALKEEKDDSFFLFDGASLLYSLDKSEVSTAAVLDAMQRSSFTEIDPLGFIHLTLELSHHGADVGPLAVKYLAYPKVDTYVPEHAMKLGRVEGGVVLFGSMPAARSDQCLLPLLSSNNPEVRNAAAMLLGFSLTEDSFKALKSPGLLQGLTPSTQKDLANLTRCTPVEQLPPPKWNREQVLRFFRRIPHTEKEYKALQPEFEKSERAQQAEHASAGKQLDDRARAAQMEHDVEEREPFFDISGAKRFQESAIQTLTADDLPELREDRRKSILGVSDEALDEYFAYTRIILGIINRLDLYEEYRTH